MLFGVQYCPSLERTHMIQTANCLHSHELACFPGSQRFPQKQTPCYCGHKLTAEIEGLSVFLRHKHHIPFKSGGLESEKRAHNLISDHFPCKAINRWWHPLHHRLRFHLKYETCSSRVHTRNGVASGVAASWGEGGTGTGRVRNLRQTLR